jgi:hypothetical protein
MLRGFGLLEAFAKRQLRNAERKMRGGATGICSRRGGGQTDRHGQR